MINEKVTKELFSLPQSHIIVYDDKQIISFKAPNYQNYWGYDTCSVEYIIRTHTFGSRVFVKGWFILPLKSLP